MKALVGTFNQEKALVGAFSVIVKTNFETDGSSAALHLGHADAPPPPLLAGAHHDGEGGGHLLRRVRRQVEVLPRAQPAEGGGRVVDRSTPVQALGSRRNCR